MILYYLDRFGLPVNYRGLWSRLLHKHEIPPYVVRDVSLHRELGGTLLQKHGNRKAPMWAEHRADEIRRAIEGHVKAHQPRVIVLSAPEALVVTNLHPEHATLSNLRGSVYDVLGVPALVMLPMSAWASRVSIKEIGTANYGETDAEAFEEAHAADSEDTAAGDDAAEDRFWYEPVQVPVGQAMIQFDMGKLSRIYHGRAGELFDAI